MKSLLYYTIFILVLTKPLFSQTKKFCTQDSQGTKYELTLSGGSGETGTVISCTYSKSGMALNNVTGTYSITNEGVYGAAYFVNIQLPSGNMKFLASYNSDGEMESLKDVYAGRGFYLCSNKKPGELSSNDDGSQYAWNQEKHSLGGSIEIGNQTWSCPNLNVDVFRNGDKIPEAKSDEEWRKYNQEKKPAWCYYNNDSSKAEINGKLYNYYAIIDPRGLAPIGWRIPTISDWDNLIEPYGGRTLYSRAANYLKARDQWAKSDISEETKFSNTTGFDAKPSGYRQPNGAFLYQSYWGVWWNADGTNIHMSYDSHILGSVNFQGNLPGLSVRLIKDKEDFEKLPYNKFISSQEIITNTKLEPTLQGTINRIETRAIEKKEIVFNNDDKRTAIYTEYLDNKEVANVKGNWTITKNSDGTKDFIFSYTVSTKSGYETSYGSQRTLFRINFDEDNEMKSIGLNKPFYMRENYDYYKSKIREKKELENRLIKEQIEYENRFNINPQKIIGTPIKMDGLEVSQFYYSNNFGKASYNDAEKIANILGDGWRLPTENEIILMTRKSVSILIPGEKKYKEKLWSGTSDLKSESKALVFENGKIKSILKSELCPVRFVRGEIDELNSQQNLNHKIIENPISIGDLLVSSSALDYLYSYEDAVNACKALGEGWRIPTKKEMQEIYKNQEKTHLATYDIYWTSTFCSKEQSGHFITTFDENLEILFNCNDNDKALKIYHSVRPVKKIE